MGRVCILCLCGVAAIARADASLPDEASDRTEEWLRRCTARFEAARRQLADGDARLAKGEPEVFRRALSGVRRVMVSLEVGGSEGQLLAHVEVPVDGDGAPLLAKQGRKRYSFGDVLYVWFGFDPREEPDGTPASGWWGEIIAGHAKSRRGSAFVAAFEKAIEECVVPRSSPVRERDPRPRPPRPAPGEALPQGEGP